MKSFCSAEQIEMISVTVKNEFSGCASRLEKVAHAIPASSETLCFVFPDWIMSFSIEVARCLEYEIISMRNTVLSKWIVSKSTRPFGYDNPPILIVNYPYGY